MSTYFHNETEKHLERYTEEGQGFIWFECDGCEELLDTGEEGYCHAWNIMHRKGWKSAKISDEWKHLCSNCSEDGKEFTRGKKNKKR